VAACPANPPNPGDTPIFAGGGARAIV